MKNYDLKGIEYYFNSLENLRTTSLVSHILYNARLDCHEDNFEKDIYENCDSREEAEKWSRRYVKIDGLVYDKATLLQAIKDELNSEIRHLEKMENTIKN